MAAALPGEATVHGHSNAGRASLTGLCPFLLSAGGNNACLLSCRGGDETQVCGPVFSAVNPPPAGPGRAMLR
jgi:hypothetical protein